MTGVPASSHGGAGFDLASSWIKVFNSSPQGPLTADGSAYTLSFGAVADSAGSDLALHSGDATKLDILTAGRYSGWLQIITQFTGVGATSGNMDSYLTGVFDLYREDPMVTIATPYIYVNTAIEPETVTSVPVSLQLKIQPTSDGTGPAVIVTSVELVMQRLA